MRSKDVSATVGVVRELTHDLGVPFLEIGLDLFDPNHTTIEEVKEKFARFFPDVAERGVQVVTPLVARLLWGYAGGGNEQRKAELLQALHEVVESYNLTVDPDELFRRMLEIAVSITGAEGGSLMLLDEAGDELRVR